MKKLFLIVGFLLGASARAEIVHLDNTEIFNLNDERNRVEIMVAYPGKKMSGLCAIEIRSDRFTPIPLAKLLEKVNLSYVFSEKEKPIDIVSHNILRISLMPLAYIDGFEISTKDGSSLRKVIQETLGSERSVVAIARACP